MKNLNVRILATLLACLPGAAFSADSAAPTPTRGEIEAIVRQYILDHPDVLMESVREGAKKQEADRQKSASLAIRDHEKALLRDPSSPSAGASAEASPLTIVEFFDYGCGYCKKVAPTVSKMLAANPKVRIVYKDLPILGPNSIVAARAALAAGKQGAYVKFHQALLANTKPLTEEVVLTTAAEVGIDLDRLKADMNTPDVSDTLVRNQALASDLSIGATPSFIVGSEMIPGAMDEKAFQELLTRTQALHDSTMPPASASGAGGSM